MHYKLQVLSVFVVLLPIATGLGYSSNDDIAIVRQRVLEQMVWPASSTVPSIVKNALHYVQTLNSSCYWPDVNYTDQSRAVWLTANHISRVTTMLQAYTVNGSTERNNTELLSAVHCALNVWLTRDWQNPNWWWNRISVPISVTGQLLMLNGNVSSFELQKIKEISYRANWWAGDIWTTGCNLVWMIQAQLYRSLATQNVTGIEQGFSRMWEDIIIQPRNKEGVQNDFAYHFHGTQLLSGAYGRDWAINIFAFFLCSVGTQYAVDTDRLTVFSKFLVDGDAWMVIADKWDWHVRGRAATRANSEDNVGYNPDHIRAVAQVISDMTLRNELNDFADRIEKLPNAKAIIGSKHFYTADYHSHRRANWSATIKMQSTRTNPDECGNGENLKREHTGQGTLNLFTTNIDDYHWVFPVLDWQALNGITVEHDIPLADCGDAGRIQKLLPFVGGVSDGLFGLAMMDTATRNLTAQRSWHFYDDAIIALATNLTLTTPNIAWTTLASRKLLVGQVTVGFFNSTIITLTDGNYSFPFTSDKTSNVQWVHVGETDFGYVLQGQGQYASLGIEVGNKTGNFDTIGAWNVNVTWRTLKIWIDHGRGPYTLDYEYMILPNVSLEAMPAIIKQYEEEQIFSCISSNKLFHGTMWPTLKRASFVLWDNVTTTFSCKSPSFELNIELSDAGAYLFSETETDFTVTASQPVRVNGAVKVTVDRIGQGQGCSSSIDNENASTTSVILPLPSSTEFIGASVQTKCNKH